tara:strand:+ start:2384 stop:3274 length:891 start_codon:yes stop_codon:yes gene_type:complete
MPPSEQQEGEDKENSTLVGLWKLRSKIGDGFSSKVYLATHIHTGIVAAVKKVNVVNLAHRYRDIMTADQVRMRLNDEVTIMYELNHPCIPRPLQMLVSVNHVYICMSYASGRSLLELLGKDLPESRVGAIMYQLLHAMQYIHSKDICHGDLKPENILIDEENGDKITVLDFGFARRVESGREVKAIGWTTQYAPPEAFRAAFVSKAWDIWSCGVIMYVLLTGNFPFNNNVINWNSSTVSVVDVVFPRRVSDAAAEAVMGMFTMNMLARPSAEQVLKFPFFSMPEQSGGCSSSSSSD